MIFRNDLRRPPEIPAELNATILLVGGTNIFDEALFRIVLAEDRVTMAAGEWTEWDEDVPLEDRGSLGLQDLQRAVEQYHMVVYAASKTMSRHAAEELSKKLGAELDEMLKSKLVASPKSVEVGMRQVQIYPFEGFILEKWKPADTFGSQEDWYQYKFNGLSALGAYPVHGEYEYLAGPTPYLPTSEQITQAIKQNFRDIAERPKSARERLLMMMNKRELAQKAKQKEKRNFAEAFNKDLNPIMRTMSLGAGRVRNALAAKAGIKEHCGN